MKKLAAWFSGDDRTLALFLGTGVLTIAFFRIDVLRDDLGVAATPAVPVATLVVVAALAWQSMLARSFVWLEPAVLTWRDDVDRRALVTRRATAGWLVRQLALGYVLALLAALTALPAAWVLAGVAVLAGAGVLAGTAALRTGTHPVAETALPVLVAGAVVLATPNPAALCVLAAVLAAAALAVRTPRIDPGRTALVDGWRERVLRTTGVQFLDLGLLLPAARPARRVPTTGVTSLAVAGVLGRARHLPSAVLLAAASVAVHRTFPALPTVVVVATLGYLAVLPFGAGLGDLWRSPGRRRWVGASDTALRGPNLLVLTALAACWVAPIAALVGDPHLLYAIPLVAASTVRTVTRRAPRFDALGEVATPMGVMPVRLMFQTVRGPDLGALAVLLLPVFPPGVAAAALLVALVR